MVQLSRSQVSNLETNFNEPDLKSLDRIASFFNTSIDALLGRNIPESEEQLKIILEEIQTVFAGLDESQREQFCKQLLFYTQFLNEKKSCYESIVVETIFIFNSNVFYYNTKIERSYRPLYFYR